MSVEIFTGRRLKKPREHLAWLIERIGALMGNVELFNEPAGFRLILNLSIAALFAGKPWTFE
jgi:hypothetical protein